MAGTRRRRSANDDDTIAGCEAPFLAGCVEGGANHTVRRIELIAQNGFDAPDEGESAYGCLLRTDRDDRNTDAVSGGNAGGVSRSGAADNGLRTGFQRQYAGSMADRPGNAG